jgi:dihydroxyacetone kinase
LNAADAQVGDGDTGSTVAQACRTLLEREGDLPFADQAALFNAVGNALSAAMGGSSGVLLAIFCSSAGTASAEGVGYSDALLAGLDAVKRYGGAKPGDRTMVDALEPALIVLSQGGSIADAARAAREGAERTRLMDKALAGRSAYLNTKSLQGNVDPGSEAVARAFEALSK